MTKVYGAEEINRIFPVGVLFESNLIRRGFLELFSNDLLELMSDDDFLNPNRAITIQQKDILVRLNLDLKGDFVKVFVVNKNQICWICVTGNALERLWPL